MNAAILLLSLSMPCQVEPSGSKYVPVPRVEPGSTLYAHRGGGPLVPVARDLFANWELQKAMLAEDQDGITALERQGRLFAVPAGTAVRVLEYHKDLLPKVPSYEVRVLDGKHAGKSGFVVAIFLKARVPDRPKAKRKRGR